MTKSSMFEIAQLVYLTVEQRVLYYSISRPAVPEGQAVVMGSEYRVSAIWRAVRSDSATLFP